MYFHPLQTDPGTTGVNVNFHLVNARPPDVSMACQHLASWLIIPTRL